MRKGFTLIELLIVITILAILSGAALPYVQNYVDEARVGRAKVDIDEIRNGLVRYEIERGIPYQQTTVASLVGPFISKALIDPWGGSYKVWPGSSTVMSCGNDGQGGNGDVVFADFRSRMAVSRAQWIDTNQDGVVNNGDSINLKLTRPQKAAVLVVTFGTDFTVTGLAAGNYSAVALGNYNMVASYGLSAVTTPFVAGSDTLTIPAATNLQDQNSQKAILDTMKILAL